jgi:Tol biopolymer transport system component
MNRHRTHFAAASFLISLVVLTLVGCGTFQLEIEMQAGSGTPVWDTPVLPATQTPAQFPAAITPTPVPDGFEAPTPPPAFTPIPVADYAAPEGLRVVVATGEEIQQWTSETRRRSVLIQENATIGPIWISDDGSIVAFMRGRDLWAVNSDGTNERLLLGEQDLASMEPLNPGVDLNLLEWVPGTHTLAFNTRLRMDHGLVLNDDLHLIDADSLERTLLLPPGDGGEFYYSPDGKQIALVTAGEITLVDAQGRQRNRVLTYTPINTGSEFQYYARPVWAQDGTALLVAIPPVELFAQPAGLTTIWHLPADGSSARLVRSVDAALSIGYDALSFSHDLEFVAYAQARQTGGASQGELEAWIEVLRLAIGDTQAYPYADALFQWAPDSERFAFTAGREQPRLYIGQWSGATLPGSVEDGMLAYDVRWVDDEHYLVVVRRTARMGTGDEGWDLMLADIHGVSTILASMDTYPVYDFALASPAEQQTGPGSPETPAVTATPVAALPGLVYQMEDGLWIGSDRGQRRIVEHSTAVISGDGSQALFLGQGPDAGDIGLAVLALGEEYNLTNTPDRIEKSPQWWPARSDVVLCISLPLGESAEGGALGYLTAVDLNSGEVRVLDEQNLINGPPAAAPDGQTIAYGSGRAGWIYRWGSGPEPFDPADHGFQGGPDLGIGSPSWSPDGRRLAWLFAGDLALEAGDKYGVVVFDLEEQTSQVLRSSAAGTGLYWPPVPTWSSDGVWLAYEIWAVPEEEEGIWVVRADGQDDTAFHLGGGNPQWSPDGKWLAFTQHKGEQPTHWIAQAGSWKRLEVALPPEAFLVGWVSQ